MNTEFIDFERPIAELEAKIGALEHSSSGTEIDINQEIATLQAKHKKLVESIFSKLNPGQIVQLARHPERPYALDYIERIFTDFEPLHGDRHFADGQTIIGGLAHLEGQPVMVMGQQKGREVAEKVKRNFGMPQPTDYRKALRLFHLAEKFGLPLITLIDTPGAYPGIQAEEQNQSEAIARNLFTLSQLKTPIICVIIGEGGSGGALAIGVGDHMAMLQYSTYSVISPEGCASILWKDAKKSDVAARAMGITAQHLYDNQLIDEVIMEPVGGAHKNFDEAASNLKTSIVTQLATLRALPIDTLLEKRYNKLMYKKENIVKR